MVDRYLRTDHEGSGDNHTGIVLAAAMTLLLIVFIVPVCLLAHYRRRRQRQVAVLQASLQHHDAASKELRYATIEAWLVSKRVYEHDQVCEILTQQGEAIPSNESSDTEIPGPPDDLVETVEQRRECPICFEPFQVNDIVSWSPNPQCDHRFHHRCVKLWLLDRHECPLCREIFLPIDAIEGEFSILHIPQLILGQKYRRLPCFYCLDHETVTVPASLGGDISNHEKDMVERVRERSTQVPDRSELVELRDTMEDVSCSVDHNNNASSIIVADFCRELEERSSLHAFSRDSWHSIATWEQLESTTAADLELETATDES